MRKFVSGLAALCVTAVVANAQEDPKAVHTALDKKNFLGGIESWWTTNNPAGPSDWFNTDMDNLAASCTVAGICLDVWDRGGAGGFYPRMGIYPESGAFPNTPDLSAPVVEISANISSTDGFSDLVVYSVPCFHLGSGDFHVAVNERSGDSNIWIGTDTDEANLGRSFNTSTAYAAGAGAGPGNWSLGVVSMPASAAQGNLYVNGVTGGNAAINVGDNMEIMYVGAAAGENFALFFCPAGVPFLLLLSVALTQTNSPFFPGPCPNTWSVAIEAGCGFVGPAIEFCAIYLDAGTGKPAVGPVAGVVVSDPNGACTGCYGRQDDGQHDGFFWKITNPSGPSDWFAVNHGTASATSAAGMGGTSMTSVEMGISENCGVAGSFPVVGVMPESVALPGFPDSSSLGLTTTGVIPANTTHNAVYPGTLFDNPDQAIDTTTVYFSGGAWSSGDTCVWFASDTDGTDDPCGNALPNTLSSLSQNGFSTSGSGTTNWNWAMKINWQ